MTDTGFTEIADLALRKTGHMFRPQQAYLLESRLGKIIRREGFSQLVELANCLKARPNAALEAEVAAALTNKHSVFFHDRELLSRIIHDILPRQDETTPRPKRRILCAGGGSGQEAYSLAILAAERDVEGEAATPIDIVSIDLCKATSARAREGIFTHFDAQNGLSIHRLLTHFTRRDDGHWQARPELRTQVSFRVHNLTEPLEGLGLFDVILCRGVLPGMADPVARDITRRLAAQLHDEGNLVLGPDEALSLSDTDPLMPSRDVRGAYILRPDDGASAAA